jgi:hypothetical protein
MGGGCIQKQPECCKKIILKLNDHAASMPKKGISQGEVYPTVMAFQKHGI